VVALGLGVLNAAVLAGGWGTIRYTRFRTAGGAITLLACLIMPLNLWYYHANGLITIGGHLWVAALVISALYLASALVLRDELFVYVFLGGVTLTGLLILADLPPVGEYFWEIAAPATLLVVLGLLAIHAERAFPDAEGPFGRRRFGRAFFFSGQALLASGLLLVLGATVAGDWLYEPVFRSTYEALHAEPSPVVGDQRWLALVLVLAGAYACLYSDIVVRQRGVYVFVAVGLLGWAQVLGLELLGWHFQTLGLLAVLLGVALHLRAVSGDLRGVWERTPPTWGYVAAMVLTAAACRLGAHLNRRVAPRLAAVGFFATAAATLVAAAALLAVEGAHRWEQQAPWLMLIPLAYLVAAHLYRGHTAAAPLAWCANAAVAVLLVSGLTAGLESLTTIVEGQPLNLTLALVSAEAVLFFALAAVLLAQPQAVHLAVLMAVGAVWQLLTYGGVEGEYYLATFAVVGTALLAAHRLIGPAPEDEEPKPLAGALRHAGQVLISVALVAAMFLGLKRLATHDVQWAYVGLCALQGLLALLGLALERDAGWKRWFLIAALGQGLMVFLGAQALTALSPLQKLEIFAVAAGLLLLAAGHVGWYREQEEASDLVSFSLLVGALLAGVPLAVATLIDRSRGTFEAFQVVNELGFLIVSVLLLATGFLFQLRTTTLVGACLTVLYFFTLFLYVPWGRINTVAVAIVVGGGALFGTGLLLSVYRERLLALPERIRKREGVFRVLGWR
jgi:hypothetical protein